MTEAQPLATVSLPRASDTRALAVRLARLLKRGDLLILVGELGAGKTTFTQGLGEGLGVGGRIASPTFVLARRHSSAVQGPDLVHVDAYRLGSAAELMDLDLEETMEDSVTVVEWGRGRAEELSESRLEIELVRPVGAPGASSAVAPWEAEDLEDDEAERFARVWAVGPRWSGEARTALLRAVGQAESE